MLSFGKFTWFDAVSNSKYPVMIIQLQSNQKLFDMELCGSRKFPHSPTEGFLVWRPPPPPPRKLSTDIILSYKVCGFQKPPAGMVQWWERLPPTQIWLWPDAMCGLSLLLVLALLQWFFSGLNIVTYFFNSLAPLEFQWPPLFYSSLFFWGGGERDGGGYFLEPHISH